MSALCYLVRLADPIRRVYDESWGNWTEALKKDTSYIGVYDRLGTAERFTREQMPLAQNPFESAMWLSWDGFNVNSYFRGDGYIWPRIDSEHPATYFGTGYHIDGFPRRIETLCEWILELGLEPPGEYERQLPETWPIWWKLMTEDMSEWECLQLRYRLGLPSLAEGLADVRWNPEPRASWMPGDGTIRFDWTQIFSVSQWTSILDQLSIKPDNELYSTTDWRNWWSAKVTRLDSEIQNFLWWYLIPYPYIIIEMPLLTEKEPKNRLSN